MKLFANDSCFHFLPNTVIKKFKNRIVKETLFVTFHLSATSKILKHRALKILKHSL